MIRSFRNKETERIWRGQQSRNIPAMSGSALCGNCGRSMLRWPWRTCAIRPATIWRLFRADRAGQWSIRINNQWRFCFRWSDGEAHDVEIVDYHW